MAGGPHATVRPDEPLQHGFRWTIRGEGEHALVELCDALDEGACFRKPKDGDPAPPWHFFPRRKGVRTVEIDDLGQIDRLAAELLQ